MTQDAQIFPDPADAIGQHEAQMLIEQAIRSFASPSAVYHIIGEGGIGKSHLLRSAFQLITERKAGLRLPVETGIIDLAHTSYQHPLWLMDTLARRVSRTLVGEAERVPLFDRFDQQVQLYIRTQSAKAQSGESLSQVRAAFLEDYQRVAQAQPLMLLIDTFERLDPRLLPLENYNFRRMNRLERWLVDLINDLDQTLTLIAGRVRPHQARLIDQQIGAKLVRRLVLQPFSPAETQAFMERHGTQQYDQAWYERMYAISGGHPVRLIVAIEIGRDVGFDPEHLPPSLQADEPADMQQLGRDFSATCIQTLQERDLAMAQLIEQATFLRKGLYEGLLQYIAQCEGDSERAAAIPSMLKRLKQMAFVKVSGDKIATLHDDVYDMLWEHSNPTSVDRWYGHTIAYLQQEIERINSAIEREGLSIERLTRLRTLQIDRLYYQLARVPTLPGYQDYNELVHSSIIGHDEEFDIQLQEDFARFFDERTTLGRSYQQQLRLHGLTWERILFDEAVRWVFRRIHNYTAEGDQNQRALELADQVAQDFAQILEQDQLAGGMLEVARLEALGLLWSAMTQAEELRQRYATVTATLRMIVEQPIDDEQPITRHIQQQARFFLAYALNNWGYLERVNERLKSATTCYREAIGLYKALGPETAPLRATTLNNLGFALASQGELDLGLHYAQRAAQLHRLGGHAYREAATQQTMALICMDLDDLPAVDLHLRRAKALFSDFPGTRLASIFDRVMGDYLSILAWRIRADVDRSEARFQEAIESYQAALNFFASRQGERERLATIYKGLGCAYRDRGYARSLRGEAGAADLEEGHKHLATALDYCPKGLPLQVDLMEDIAVSYIHERRFAEAYEQLQQAAAAIPPEYAIDAPRRVTKHAESGMDYEQPQFWLQRAQVNFQLAICALEQDNLPEAGDRFLRAFTALNRFSPNIPQHHNNFRRLTRDHTAALRSPARIKELRQATYLRSQRLQAREAFFELNRIFLEAEEIAELLD
ncbi:AAA family ATPase [Candidatus Viridilinea mediisalina]|nr:AAA family ATPase [Candidatus Viridilinea mediisalina]